MSKKLSLQPQHKRLGMIWIVAMIGCGIAYGLLTYPAQQELDGLKRRLQRQMQEYEITVEQTSETAKARLQEELDANRALLDQFVVASESLTPVHLEIRRIAQELELKEFSSQSRSQADLSEIPGCTRIGEKYIDIEFKGTYTQFAAFLNDLERMTPVLFVDRFSVARRGQLSEEPAVSITVAVLVKTPQEGNPTSPSPSRQARATTRPVTPAPTTEEL